ncbi:MAG: hypothetical protein GY839_02985 [candidate division Zixibacteria bacterium]|nr:hypothetical protein [candidate division Zixibacteria bacterium]
MRKKTKKRLFRMIVWIILGFIFFVFLPTYGLLWIDQYKTTGKWPEDVSTVGIFWLTYLIATCIIMIYQTKKIVEDDKKTSK